MAVHGAEPVSVSVLPFNVYSQEDLDYLKQGIQEMLNGQLGDYGVQIVSQDQVKRILSGITGLMDEETAKKLGRILGADYIIYGGLTKIGPHFSLDALVVDAAGVKKTIRIFVQGEGLENLLPTIKQLALKVALQVTGQQKIDRIEITGNERIEADAIQAALESKVGDIYSPTRISSDLRRIYAMNYFEDVKVDVEDTPAGKIIKYIVEEKASIHVIDIRGNNMLKEKDLLEVLGYPLYSIVDDKKVLDSVENLKELYREKGYYNAEISHTIEDIGPKRVAVRYKIKENKKIYIKEIAFEGNKGISSDDLLDLMETREKGIFSWLTDSGKLNRNELDKDMTKIVAYYHNNGYIKVQVGEPEVKVETTGLYIRISVSEGPQYRIGRVFLEGDLIIPEEEILARVKIDEEKIYNREIIQKDLEAIRMIYNAHGYAYAVIIPLITENDETLTVDIGYRATKNSLVYFERIEIAGNTRTREKVIRRELAVNEQELFSLDKLRLSMMNLHRLGYFEDIDIAQSKGSADDKMNIRVEVKEQPTGAFSFGVGWSSFNKFFTTAQISQNNLFGRGQQVTFQGTFGQMETEYRLSFIEPWLFDIPLTSSLSLYNTSTSYDLYDKYSNGASIGASYPILPFVRLSGTYRYDDSDIKNVAEDASQVFQALAGRNTLSSLTTTLKRDTRNRYYNPTAGSNNSFAIEYAGGLLGGDAAFTKYIFNSGWFFPLWAQHVFFVRGKAGWIQDRPGGILPTYEKFFLGGMNSLRGYGWGTVSPVDPETGDRIGGEKMVLFNLEYIFPLSKEQGLVGVIFYDAGNAFTADDDVDLGTLRKSYGFGLRYYSPLGPMRLEYGRVIDPRPGDDKDNWEFTIGTFF